MSERAGGYQPDRVSKLLIVVPSFYPDVFGGGERQALILAEAFGRLGVDVTLLAPTLQDASETPTEFGRIVRFKLRHLPYFGGRRAGSTIAWTLKVLRWTFAHARDSDAVYAIHGRLHATAAVAAAWVAGAPLFIKPGRAGPTFDLQLLQEKRGGYARWFARYLAQNTDGYIANSVAIAHDLRSWRVEEDRIFIVPNGAIVPEPEEVRAWQARRTGREFVYTGRIDREKGVDLLVDAFAALHADFPAARLTLVGDGPDMAALQARVAALGLAEAIRFRGLVDDVYAELKGQDFFVSASEMEGQSNSLLEAMTCGCIPIVANASGAADVVQPGWGFIPATTTVREFEELMRTALSMSAERRLAMSEAAYRFSVATFGIETVAQRTLDVMGRVKGKARGVGR